MNFWETNVDVSELIDTDFVVGVKRSFRVCDGSGLRDAIVQLFDCLWRFTGLSRAILVLLIDNLSARDRRKISTLAILSVCWLWKAKFEHVFLQLNRS